MMRKSIIIIFLILISCDIKPKSIGNYDRIIVFSKKEIYDANIDTLRKYMGDARELPIKEDLFEFEFRTFKDFKKFKTYRNIMFLLSKESKTEYNDLIDLLLSENAKNAVTSNTSNFFLTKDLYAKNQSVLLFVVNKNDDFKNLIQKQVKTLVTFDNFKESVYQRYSKDRLFGYNLVEATAESLMKQHGYSLDHSKFFKAVDNKTGVDSNIVSFFAPAPVRWYWVKYFDNLKSHSIDSYLDIRDQTFNTYFEGDDVDRRNKIYTDSVKVGNYHYLKIQGTYVTYDDGIAIGGGPFISYILNRGNRTYYIDSSLFKPGSRKSIELIQLESILKTFKLKKDID